MRDQQQTTDNRKQTTDHIFKYFCRTKLNPAHS